MSQNLRVRSELADKSFLNELVNAIPLIESVCPCKQRAYLFIPDPAISNRFISRSLPAQASIFPILLNVKALI